VASEADAIRVKNDRYAELAATAGVFGVMVRRDTAGEWIIHVLVDPSAPSPPERVLDGVPVRYVHEEPPRPFG